MVQADGEALVSGPTRDLQSLATTAARGPSDAPCYPWLGWSAWLLAAACLTLLFGLFIWHNDVLPTTNKISSVLVNVPAMAFVTVGAVIIARRPGNRIGWLCYGVGLAQILAGFGSQTAAAALAADPNPGPVSLVVYELGELSWELSSALLALLLLLFPTGQLPSPRWRPVAWAAGAVLVSAALSAPFLPGPPAPGLPPNPIAIPALAGLLRLAFGASSAVLGVVVLAALVSLIVRFRRARGVERWASTFLASRQAVLVWPRTWRLSQRLRPVRGSRPANTWTWRLPPRFLITLPPDPRCHSIWGKGMTSE